MSITTFADAGKPGEVQIDESEWFQFLRFNSGAICIGDCQSGALATLDELDRVERMIADYRAGYNAQYVAHSGNHLCGEPDCSPCNARREKKRRLDAEESARRERRERELRNPPKKKGPVPGVVYMLHGAGHYKIGRSAQKESRLKSYLRLPFAVTIIHAIQTQDHCRLEKYWHERFAHRRGNGEWFDLLPDDVSEFCSASSMEAPA